MSIVPDTAYQDPLKRVEALEMKEERFAIPIRINEPNGKLIPKHLIFGKRGLAYAARRTSGCRTGSACY